MLRVAKVQRKGRDVCGHGGFDRKMRMSKRARSDLRNVVGGGSCFRALEIGNQESVHIDRLGCTIVNGLNPNGGNDDVWMFRANLTAARAQQARWVWVLRRCS